MAKYASKGLLHLWHNNAWSNPPSFAYSMKSILKACLHYIAKITYFCSLFLFCAELQGATSFILYHFLVIFFSAEIMRDIERDKEREFLFSHGFHCSSVLLFSVWASWPSIWGWKLHKSTLPSSLNLFPHFFPYRLWRKFQTVVIDKMLPWIYFFARAGTGTCVWEWLLLILLPISVHFAHFFHRPIAATSQRMKFSKKGVGLEKKSFTLYLDLKPTQANIQISFPCLFM